MLRELVIVIIIVLYNMYLFYYPLKASSNVIKNIQKCLLGDLLILLILALVGASALISNTITNCDNGFLVSERIEQLLILFFVIPFFINIIELLGLIKGKKFLNETSDIPKEVVPRTKIEYLWFLLFIVIGVVLEEVSRYLLIFSLSDIFHINGDIIIILSVFIFFISHQYHNLYGRIYIIVVHLFLGKILLHTDSIFICIALHLMINFVAITDARKVWKNYLK